MMRIDAQRSRPPRARRGMTIIVVLGLLAVCLALAYAVLRSQSSSLQVQRNTNRNAEARQAAATGLSVGLRRMHLDDWNGVGTAISGQVSRTAGYSLTYTAGDPALSPGSADDVWYPYRITLLSTGYSQDPGDPNALSTWQVRAVVQLVPRQLSDQPVDWDNMQQYAVYQRTAGTFSVDVPASIAGQVWVQGELRLCDDYPEDPPALQRYLEDLARMRNQGQGDYRPLLGKVGLLEDQQADETLSRLSWSGIQTEIIPSQIAWPWPQPGGYTTYQLYPGGPEYSIPQVPRDLQNVSLGPDPRTNPLGVFYRNGEVQLGDNVTLRGTLIASGDVHVLGDNVSLRPFDLPPSDGGTAPLRLPTVMAGDDVQVHEPSGGQIRGIVSAWDDFQVNKGAQSAALDVEGRVISSNFLFGGRNEWDGGAIWWQHQHADFLAQKGGVDGIKYFPLYLQSLGYDAKPRITIRPPRDAATYHWLWPSNPVYVADPGDGGLRWELLDWTENP